jgi:hypothetical protein
MDPSKLATDTNDHATVAIVRHRGVRYRATSLQVDGRRVIFVGSRWEPGIVSYAPRRHVLRRSECLIDRHPGAKAA